MKYAPTNKVQTAKMMAIVATAFDGVFDKAGEPYFDHCYTVMKLLGDDAPEERKQIALGHDLFEDTKVTAQDLRDAGFSGRVIDGIFAMTKHRGQSKVEYEEQVISNEDAIFVKMADLTHNSDIRRIKGEPDEDDFKRTAAYRRFYDRLKRYLANRKCLTKNSGG